MNEDRQRAGPPPGAPPRPAPAAARARVRAAGRAGLAVVALAMLAGCGINPQRLTLRDSSSRDADAIVTVRPAAWSRGSGGPARGFEAGYQQFRAEGTQDVLPGETVVVSGTGIAGPDVLQQQAKVVTWHFGFTDRFYFGPAFEFDIGVGGMKTEMSYELVPRSGVVGRQPFAREYTLPYGAVTPRWRFGPHVAIESRLVAAGLTDDAELRRYDAAVVLSPAPQVSLRLGWSHRRTRLVVSSDPVFSSLDVTVRSQGPQASLRIDF